MGYAIMTFFLVAIARTSFHFFHKIPKLLMQLCFLKQYQFAHLHRRRSMLKGQRESIEAVYVCDKLVRILEPTLT